MIWKVTWTRNWLINVLLVFMTCALAGNVTLLVLTIMKMVG